MGNEDDTVGYGRPPKHTRFQKGRSGNPRGRPKGSTNVKTAIRRAIARTIPVKIGKRTVNMSPMDAVAHRIVQKALEGDAKAIEQLVRLGGLQDEFAASAQRASAVGSEDLDLLRRALARSEVTPQSAATPRPLTKLE